MQGDAASFTGKREDSEDASPDPSSDGKRRKAQGASSRGVANLTPDQLAKKRANDREAQRAIRERTKNQIESLERKIRELTSQQPYQELQHVLRQKEAVELENVEIRKRLASVLSIIQPVLGHQQHPIELSYSSPLQQYPQQPTGPAQSINTPTPPSIPSPTTSIGGSQWHMPPSSGSSEVRNVAQSRAFTQQRYDLAHGLDMGPERLGLDFLLDGTQRINRIPVGVNGAQFSSNLHPSRFKEPDLHTHQRSNSGGSVPSTMGYIPGEVAAHAAPIRNGPPTCPLDSLLLDFLHERQQLAAEGVATPKLVGPAYPSVSSLLNPARSVHSHPLSQVFTDILGTFPDISTLPEKVATLYIMFLIMRWQISPTQENYDRLPEWVTPRPSQLFTPHPAWIDHVPWPRMRDKLVRDYNPDEYLFDNFFIPFTTTMSVNWPYEPEDSLLASMEGEELVINPVFERHLRRLDNWSLGPAFAQAFPGLVDTFRLKVDGDRK